MNIGGFTVRFFSSGLIEEYGVMALILAESDSTDARRLEIQLALEFDESDIELGMNTYCISTESGASFYGGITSAEIAGGRLTINLTTKAAEGLGLAEILTFELSVSDESLRKISEELSVVLKAN